MASKRKGNGTAKNALKNEQNVSLAALCREGIGYGRCSSQLYDASLFRSGRRDDSMTASLCPLTRLGLNSVYRSSIRANVAALARLRRNPLLRSENLPTGVNDSNRLRARHVAYLHFVSLYFNVVKSFEDRERRILFLFNAKLPTIIN